MRDLVGLQDTNCGLIFFGLYTNPSQWSAYIECSLKQTNVLLAARVY